MDKIKMLKGLLTTVQSYTLANKEVVTDELLAELNEQIWYLEDELGKEVKVEMQTKVNEVLNNIVNQYDEDEIGNDIVVSAMLNVLDDYKTNLNIRTYEHLKR